jgi:hypothetical protein
VSFGVGEDGVDLLFILFINYGGHRQMAVHEHAGRFVPERWYHFALVHTPEGRSIYLDGALVISQSTSYRTSDRIGLMRLGGFDAKGSSFQGTLDELAVYDCARSPVQIAHDALLLEVPQRLVEVETPPRPMLAEAPLLPEDVSHFVETVQHEAFTVYKPIRDLSSNPIPDLDAFEGTVWIGQQRGLVRFDRTTHMATLYTEKDGLPGYIVSGIGVEEDAVWVSAYANSKEGVRSSGIVRIPRR